MLGFSDPRQTLVSLHDMLTGWQSIRDRRRMRHADYPAPECGAPAASMHTAPVSGTPPAPGSTVIGFHKMGDRIVPIYGDSTEAPEPAANATQPSRDVEVPTPSASPPSAATSPGGAPQAAPPEATLHSQPTTPTPPPPPDFTPAAVAASVPSRTVSTPPVLDLPPPTPPLLVRTDEQAVMLERVLAEHRAELARQSEAQQAQHAAVMHAILAQYRLAQAEADAHHRQQLADLLAQHRGERQGASEMMAEHGLAVVQLREVLAEQASAQHAEHVRIGDKIEAITDMVGMVGETVHRIAAAAFPPPASPPEQAATPRPSAESTNPRPPPPPTVATPTTAPADIRSAEPARVQEGPRPATTAAPTPALRPGTGAGPSPAGMASACASASPRGPDFGPAASSILALADSHGSMTSPSAMTPRQRRAEEEARERRRLDEAVASFDDDTTNPDEAPHG